MEKDIIEFLKYYIGQKIMSPAGEIERLVVVGLLGNNEQKYRTLPGGTSFTRPWQQGNKLILRRLDSMTEVERKEMEATMAIQKASPVHQFGVRVWTANTFHYLLSKGFDLFGLIDAGLALDQATLSEQNKQ